MSDISDDLLGDYDLDELGAPKPAKEPCEECGDDGTLLGYRYTACCPRCKPTCETCGGTGRVPTTLQGSTTTQWHSKPCPDCKEKP